MKKMKNIKNIMHITLTVIILGLPSCSNPERLYEEYIVPGGLSYPAKALDAAAYPGKERIEISWKNGVDPKVVKASISWNNETDRKEIDIQPGADVIRRIIEPLDENTYSFMIRTYDADGNVSIPVEVIGDVYGEVYESSLVNRILKEKLFDGSQGLTLEWFEASKTETGINLSYTDINGVPQTIFIDKLEMSTFIADFDVVEPLFYNTVYRPDSLAIDDFQAPTIEVQIDPNILIPKNTWLEYPLPGDAASLNASLGIQNMWNNNMASGSCFFSDMLPLPQLITWDLGRTIIMNRFKIWPRNDLDDTWKRSHPKIFELYGSTAPNPDGSLDNSWTPLGRFEYVKPSPGETITQTDIDFARAGIDFELAIDDFAPDPFVPVRYIRIRTLETYSFTPESYVSIQEINIWGKLMK